MDQKQLEQGPFVPTYKRKMRVSLTNSLNAVRSWNIIGPVVSDELTKREYMPIPFFLETYAYKPGQIFVQTGSQVGCFRLVPLLQVLGPIRDFVAWNATDRKLFDRNFQWMRSCRDRRDFRIIGERGKNSVAFTAYDCYALSKAQDAMIERNVTINRSSHEGLSTAKWFGLITSTVMATASELHAVKEPRERKIFIGGQPHTILFKYEVCEMDETGMVTKNSEKKINGKWLPLHADLDGLPIPDFPAR